MGKDLDKKITLADLSFLTRSPCSLTLGSCRGTAPAPAPAFSLPPPESLLSTVQFCP